MNNTVDVVILGGGLAGLSLAIQLKRMDPALHVTAIERQQHPVREAAFKVGESTVEIAAHYFGHVLGLREHLDSAQVRKFGFRFFFSDGVDAIDRCTELGVSTLLPMISWQLDRGRFENFLGERARELGVVFLDGATVKHIDPASDGGLHAVEFERDGTATRLEARWLVDAAGRANLLKRKFGLAEDNSHNVNAAWWRVDGIVDPNLWSRDNDWLQRCTPPDRWRSTNHLCGRGYWAWMIPLASGMHSIGIVADGAQHPLEGIKTHALATAWLREHQPALAKLLDDPRHAVQDFRFLRHFSHDCKQVFSADRWAITGEAGLFLDPFYSPGSDFIAIGNTYICDLIRRDRAGQPFAPYAGIYQQLIDSFFDNTLTLYQDQYALFGDARVMPLKVIWDYTYYWSLLAPLFTGGRIADIAMIGKLRPALDRASGLNIAMQKLLRAWGERNGAPSPPQDDRVLDQYLIPWFHELNRALTDPPQDDATFRQRVTVNVTLMERLALQLLAEARKDHPDIDDAGLSTLLEEGVAPGEPLLQAPWVA